MTAVTASSWEHDRRGSPHSEAVGARAKYYSVPRIVAWIQPIERETTAEGGKGTAGHHPVVQPAADITVYVLTMGLPFIPSHFLIHDKLLSYFIKQDILNHFLGNKECAGNLRNNRNGNYPNS